MTTRDEQGSLIIALAVILVLSGLTLAVLARTVSALGSARLSQDTAAAVAAADAGVADAQYVLDNWDTSGPWPQTLSGAAPDGSFSWTATYQMFTADVSSIGTVNHRSHTVQVQLRRRRRWPWMIATSGSLVFDGTDSISSVVSGKPTIAAGGPMVLRNGASGGVQQELLAPGASCSGCTASVSPSITTTLPDPVLPTAPAPTPLTTCTGITALTTGTYLCSGDVSFGPGAVSVGPGPVDLYVTSGYGPPPTVSFAGATVNDGGDASQFAIHVVGAGVIQPGDGPLGAGPTSAGSLTGIIDAPRSSLRSADCEFSLTGAADLGSFDCVTPPPGPGPILTYDAAVASIPSMTWHEATYQDAAGP